MFNVVPSAYSFLLVCFVSFCACVSLSAASTTRASSLFFFLAFFHFYSHTVHVRTRGCRSRASSPHSSRLFYVLRFLIVPENCFSPLFRIFTCLRNSIEFLFDIVVQKKKNTHTHTHKQTKMANDNNKQNYLFFFLLQIHTYTRFSMGLLFVHIVFSSFFFFFIASFVCTY